MPSLVVVGAQWGDEGKGKIVDALAGESDVVVRFQGGDNAGHTVFHNGDKFVFHILPCGMLHDGVLCVIGGGVVVNLQKLTEELKMLPMPASEAIQRLRISGDAHIILPCHLAEDRRDEAGRGGLKIGTTQRGIGPAYADRAARTGLRMADTLDGDYFRARLGACLDMKRGMLKDEDAEGACDFERIAAETLALAAPFSGSIVNTGVLLEDAMNRGKRILFEGAQGTMLDISGGTYPYVTSSHTIAGGVCVGTGIGPHAINRIAGVTKAYATRVGEGPFPTELNDDIGSELRRIGREYGATTGRPRRCGWLDLVQLRHARRLNSLDELVMTKLDVLDAFDKIGVCTAYLCGGKRVTELPCNPLELASAKPEYEFLAGWKSSTANADSFEKLPREARDFIAFVERAVGAPVSMISTGKERSQLIIRNAEGQ